MQTCVSSLEVCEEILDLDLKIYCHYWLGFIYENKEMYLNAYLHYRYYHSNSNLLFKVSSNKIVRIEKFCGKYEIESKKLIQIEKQLSTTTDFSQEFIEKLQVLKSGYNALCKKSYNIAYFDFIQASVLIKSDKPIEGVRQLVNLISKKDWFFKPLSYLFGYLIKKDLLSALRLSIYGLFVYSNNDSTSREFSSVIIMLTKALIMLGFIEESVLILKAVLNRFCYKTRKSFKSYFGFFNELNHGFNLQLGQDNLGVAIEKYSKYELFQEINSIFDQSRQLSLIRDSSNDDGNILEGIEKEFSTKLKIYDTNSSYESYVNKKVMGNSIEVSELRSIIFSLTFREPISQFNFVFMVSSPKFIYYLSKALSLNNVKLTKQMIMLSEELMEDYLALTIETENSLVKQNEFFQLCLNNEKNSDPLKALSLKKLKIQYWLSFIKINKEKLANN